MPRLVVNLARHIDATQPNQLSRLSACESALKGNNMNPLRNYELTVRSTVLRGEKPTVGLKATEAANPNQMNRVVGFLPDGTQVIVAQRPGKGGMDFNKLMGGKVFAVAADGVSPVFEKGEDKKPTKIQKKEDGLPLYSSSGFYLMSSKEYPAMDIVEAYTLLRDNGNQVWLLTEKQLAARQKMTLSSDMDLDLLIAAIKVSLSDEHNLVARFDAETNKKRERTIRRAREDAEVAAEDGGDPYAGVEFMPLAVSKKDGNPFVLFCWMVNGADPKMGAVTRELETIDDGRKIAKYLTVDEAVAHFETTAGYRELAAALEAGKVVDFSFAQGHVMRTSVSFRRKAENVLKEVDKPAYGDAVYIHAALKGWTKGLLSILQSQHPNFPMADYDAHHYVAACRQAEIGMDKKDGKWTPPAGLQYRLAAALVA